jgi:thiol-disulfide isomerase/thioredoxin
MVALSTYHRLFFPLKMMFATSIGPARAFVLGLALLSADPVLAQKTIAKAKINTPQPTSPLVSAPQVVLAAAPAAIATPATAEVPAGWLTDLGVAQAKAKATNRPILAVFSGSDWCKPCIMYEQEVFAKPEFTAFAKDKLVLAHFDFPRMKKNQPTAAQLKLNEAAAAQLNREGDFPLAVLIAPDGKVLAKTGYIAGGPTAFEAYLKKVVPTL